MENKKSNGAEQVKGVRVSGSSPTWDIASLRAENNFLKTDNEILKAENEEFDKKICRMEKINNMLLERAEKNASVWASGLFYVGVLTGVSFTLGLPYVLDIISKMF